MIQIPVSIAGPYIYVITLTGRSISVDFDEKNTILDVKNKIKEMEEIPIDS